MRRVASRGLEPVVRVNRGFRRVIASSVHVAGVDCRFAAFALGSMVAAAGAGLAIAQGAKRAADPLHAAPAGPGLGFARRRRQQRRRRPHRPADRPERPRVPGHPGGHAGCRLLRELLHLRQGAGAQPEMPQDERPRRGCAPSARRAPAAARRRSPAAAATSGGRPSFRMRWREAAAAARCARRSGGGGLFDFFGGGQEQEEEQQPETPIYRSIDPNGRYRSVCVRLCDGFFYPISFATYASRLAQEQRALPVELRGAGRALRLSQSRTGDRAGHLAERLGLYGPSGRAQISASPT